MPIASRSAATSRDGTTSAAPDSTARRSAASCQRAPAPRRRFGMAAPGHVVDRHDQPCRARAPEPGRRPATPSARCRTPPGRGTARGPRPGSGAGPGQPRRVAAAARRRPAGRPTPPGARLARSVTSTASPSAATGQARRAGHGRSAPMPPGTRRRSCSTARSTDGADRSATAGCRRVAIERLEPGAAPLPRIARRPRRAGGDEATALRLVAQARVERLDEAVVIARPRPAGRRRRAPRATSRHASPPRAPRPAWPATAGSRTPRRGRGRPARWPADSSAARSGLLDPARADDPVPRRRRRRWPTASASSPHPGGPARTSATSAWRPATASKARTRPGRSLRGSAVPTARQKRPMPGGRKPPQRRRGIRRRPGAGRSGMPGWTTRTRDGSASNASTTSPATKAESVWTQAPRPRARRINPG